MTRRTERVNDLIRDEISDILRKGVKDPRLAHLVTVTEVVVSPDLRLAKVFISVLGTEEEKKETMAGLNAAKGFLRHELRNRLTLRYVPDLDFRYDSSIEHGAHILALLKEVTTQDESSKNQEAE